MDGTAAAAGAAIGAETGARGTGVGCIGGGGGGAGVGAREAPADGVLGGDAPMGTEWPALSP